LLLLPTFALALLCAAPLCTCRPDCAPARLATRSTSVSLEGIAAAVSPKEMPQVLSRRVATAPGRTMQPSNSVSSWQFPRFLLKGSRWEFVV
jgi:hypothetical protein